VDITFLLITIPALLVIGGVTAAIVLAVRASKRDRHSGS